MKTITKVKEYDTPNMKRIGLFNIDGVDWMEKEEHPIGSYARMKEQSRGKKTPNLWQWRAKLIFRMPGVALRKISWR